MFQNRIRTDETRLAFIRALDMKEMEINKLKGLLDGIYQGIVSTEPMSFMEIKEIIEEME